MGKFLCFLFKSSIFWIIVTALLFISFIVLINILIAILWSFLINKFIPISYLFIKYLIILILFLLNWLILRKIVISWLFEWQFPTQKFSIYKERQNFISFLKLHLRNFINAIDIILDVNSKLTQKEIDFIDKFLEIFDDQLNLYEQLYNIVNNNANNNNIISYSMSRYQIEYYNKLKAINHILIENDIKNNLLNIKNNNNSIKMNNYTVNQNFENQKNLLQLNMILRQIQSIIAKYDWDNYTYMSPSYLCNLLFNDTFGSLSLNALNFKRKLKEYHLEENFTKKNKIHYTLVRNKIDNNNKSIDKSSENNLSSENNIISESNLISDNSDSKDALLMIFCLPNGGCYELLPKAKIEFYLNLGFSFLLWNYKGYGYSKGRADFSNCKSAVLEVYDTIVGNPKYNFKKICVMGHSIGGVAACYLAKNRRVDLLISDRNFCDISRLANNFYCGKLLSTLIKILFIGNTDNINNFFNSNIGNGNNGVMKIKNFDNKEEKSTINKIIIYSPLDVLILNDSTVKSGISRYIIKNYVIYINNENMQTIKDKENFLDIVFNTNEKSRFINNFRTLLHYYYDKDINAINKNDVVIKIKKENNKNENSINENNSSIEENQTIEDTLFSFFDMFFGICCDNLNYLSMKRLSVRRETIYLDNFFNNLLIWGVQGGESPTEEVFEFYSYKGKKLLKEASNILYNFSSNYSQININPIIGLIKSVSDDLKKILNVMENLDIALKDNQNVKKNNKDYNINISNEKMSTDLKEKLISKEEKENEINTNITFNSNKKEKLNNEDKFYDKLNNIKGNIKLFKSFAGHNGLLRSDEREQFYSFLLCTGIIS